MPSRIHASPCSKRSSPPVVASVRDLFGNPNGLPADAAWPLQHAIAVSLAWCVAILAVCVPLAMRRYRLATAR
jgi:ABC-2 type transport system permease protein